jgi:hypothetical protein
MEFENRCHKVQEPKFDCLLFGKPLLLCFLQKCCRHVAVLFLLRSVVALFLCPFTECKGFLTCLFLPADLDVTLYPLRSGIAGHVKKNIVGEVPLLLLLLAAACFLTV